MGEPGGGAAMPPTDPAFTSARDQLRTRLADWQPPEGADPAEVAELRQRLGGLLDRYQPRQGQTAADAIAELRDEFALRIDDFTQDQKLDALIEAQQGQPGQAGGMAPPSDPEFEATRQMLRDRLAGWQPPEGTDPAQAAELKADLQAMIDRYRPLPGQSREDAVAELQDRFDGKVDDFERDQKIDALIEAEQGAEGTETETPPTGTGTDPATGAPMAPPPPPPPGAGQDPATGGAAPPPPPPPPPATGATGGATMPPPPSPVVGMPLPAEDSPPPPDDAEPSDDGPQGVAIGEMDPTARTPDADTAAPDPRVTMPADALVDEFDEMVADAAPPSEGATTGMPTAPTPDGMSAAVEPDVLGDVAVATAVADAPAPEVDTAPEPASMDTADITAVATDVYTTDEPAPDLDLPAVDDDFEPATLGPAVEPDDASDTDSDDSDDSLFGN
jgi:hypothetical protein